MYVNSRGVTTTNPRNHKKQDPHSDSWPQPEGHALETPQRMSRLAEIAHRANSVVGMIVLGALIVTTGLAYAITTDAQAHVPGSVTNVGKAPAYGSPAVSSSDEAIGIATTKNSEGYWVATKRGRVFSFGNAGKFGELPANEVNYIVDIIPTSTGNGYWLMGVNGSVYTFGDAPFLGTAEDSGVWQKNFVALVPTQSNNGYLLVQDNGQVLSFGDAQELGEPQGLREGDTIVSATATPDGNGYAMLSAKGSVFTFGDAKSFGSVDESILPAPATSISITQGGEGYWILSEDGSIFNFGDAANLGNAVEAQRSGAPSVDLAIFNNGTGYWIANGKDVAPVIHRVKRASVQTPAVAAVAVAAVSASDSDVWAALRKCEAGGNYATNTGNGYYGAYQFSAGTWRSMNTGYDYAHLAPPAVQDDAARRLQARGGWGQWPACSRKIGVR